MPVAGTTRNVQSQQPPREHFAGARSFWARVSDGLAIDELWAQFRADTRSGYRLYKKEIHWEDASTEGHRGHWHLVKSLFWAILLKLSPARRVLLLAGIVMLVVPTATYESGSLRVVGDWRFVGTLAILLVLVLEVTDRVVMKRDLEIAREIQSWLVPSLPPPVPGLDIAFATRPANTVAGDYYDVFPRDPVNPNSRFLLVIADVAGKSIPAALLMATLQASLRTLSTSGCSLPELLAGVNRYASAHSAGGLRFTTAFLAEYDSATRAIEYINAGHNAPILRRGSGAVERLERGGLPLGIQPEAQYETGTTALAANDLLVIFTDGLVEAENERQEEFGDPRLLALVARDTQGSAAAFLQSTMGEVERFVRGAPQHDDITCMVVKAV